MHVIDGTKLGAKTKLKPPDGLKALLKVLEPVLDDRFALVHSLTMPGRRENVDALLVGPHGTLVIKIDNSSGRHRCLGENWYVWDKKAEEFWPTEESPLRELKQGHKLVEAVLVAQGMGSVVPVDSVAIFVNPKLQLEHLEPIVRLIDAKSLPDFAAQLMSAPAYVEKRDIEKTLSVFGAQASIAFESQSMPQPQDTSIQRTPRAPRSLFGLKRWQLIAVGAMVAAYVLLLIIAVIVFMTV